VGTDVPHSICAPAKRRVEMNDTEGIQHPFSNCILKKAAHVNTHSFPGHGHLPVLRQPLHPGSEQDGLAPGQSGPGVGPGSLAAWALSAVRLARLERPWSGHRIDLKHRGCRNGLMGPDFSASSLIYPEFLPWTGSSPMPRMHSIRPVASYVRPRPVEAIWNRIIPPLRRRRLT